MTNQVFPEEASSLEYAKYLDETDPVKGYKQQFFIPQQPDGKPQIYFNGNSLGLQPKNVQSYLSRIMEEWRAMGVKGHFKGDHPWIPYHERLAPSMAKVVGAHPHEIVIMNTLTVNLHLMMASFYRPNKQRFKVLMEEDTFPSDRYAVESQIKLHGFDPAQSIIYVSPNPETGLLQEEDIQAILETKGEQIALALFGVPNYYTGQVLDMHQITQTAHQKGCKVGFNLAHGAGNLALQLHETGSDFAIWCTYKYMNAGPGNLSGCFIHERYADRPDLNRLAGWWGQKHETRFDMRTGFDPMFGANGWCVSNAPILPLGALEATLSIFEEVGMAALREKSIKLTNYLEFLLLQLSNARIQIITPDAPNKRGCQLSILVKNESSDLYDKMTSAGVITDWRKPDVIRAAPVPLYNSFEEVYNFVDLLQKNLSLG